MCTVIPMSYELYIHKCLIFSHQMSTYFKCVSTHKIAINSNENLWKRKWFRRSWNHKHFLAVLKKAYLIYTHMACILKTLDFIYSLYRNKAKKNPLKITRMNAQISSWGVTLEIEAPSTQAGIWHIHRFSWFFLRWQSKYKEIRMYMVA